MWGRSEGSHMGCADGSAPAESEPGEVHPGGRRELLCGARKQSRGFTTGL